MNISSLPLLGMGKKSRAKYLFFAALVFVSYPLMAIGWLLAIVPAVLGFLPTKLNEWAVDKRDRHRPSPETCYR